MRPLPTVCLFLCLSSFAHAGQIYYEVGDTGRNLYTAQNVGYGVTHVFGELDARNIDQVDIYRFDFGLPALVEFSVHYTDTFIDWDLFVFNSFGNPVFVSDLSYFEMNVVPGTYYFAVSDWDIAALGQDGTTIANATITQPNGVLGGWRVHGSPFRYGPYEIRLNVATSVPEPSTLYLLAFATVLVFCRTGRDLQR